MAASGVFDRIRKLEERGLVRTYTAALDPKQLGLGLLAYVFVRSEDIPGKIDTAARLAKLPNVQEVHHVAGEDCYLLKVRAADTESLGRILREEIGCLKSVRSTRTTIVLETVKETCQLPLPVIPQDQT
jgi:Lrp/AsnC family leucine-responsive transcriptional regulator